jgi:hypothetical protein
LANAIVNFDTPQSATPYYVQTIGTVAARSTAHVQIILAVTTASTSYTRNDTFYREVNLTNNLFTPALTSGTYGIAIVPKLLPSDTVVVTPVWSY